MEDVKIEIHKLLRVVYGFTTNLNNSQMITMCETSEPTPIKVKDKILKSINLYVEAKEKIGGLDVEIQINETAKCNGRLITDPSNTLDSTPKT
jgi:hypothetical protein